MENSKYLNGSPIKDSDVRLFAQFGIPLVDAEGNCLYFSFHDVIDKNKETLMQAISGDENNGKN